MITNGEKDTKEYIGRRIRNLRKDKNLHESSVADKLSISKSTYLNYESGHRSPSLITLRDIAELYDVPVSSLLKPDDTKALYEKHVENVCKKLGHSVRITQSRYGDSRKILYVMDPADGSFLAPGFSEYEETISKEIEKDFRTAFQAELMPVIDKYRKQASVANLDRKELEDNAVLSSICFILGLSDKKLNDLRLRLDSSHGDISVFELAVSFYLHGFNPQTVTSEYLGSYMTAQQNLMKWKKRKAYAEREQRCYDEYPDKDFAGRLRCEDLIDFHKQFTEDGVLSDDDADNYKNLTKDDSDYNCFIDFDPYCNDTEEAEDIDINSAEFMTPEEAISMPLDNRKLSDFIKEKSIFYANKQLHELEQQGKKKNYILEYRNNPCIDRYLLSKTVLNYEPCLNFFGSHIHEALIVLLEYKTNYYIKFQILMEMFPELNWPHFEDCLLKEWRYLTYDLFLTVS